MNIIEQFEKDQIKSLVKGKKIPQFHPGDTVRVNVKVREGTRERIQAFEGVCIRKKNRGLSSSFTVRKISFGEGVERVFPIFSPSIDSISIVRSGQVRRAKLYYLRDLTGKKARIVERIRKKQPDLASLYIDESEEVVEEEIIASDEPAQDESVEVAGDASQAEEKTESEVDEPDHEQVPEAQIAPGACRHRARLQPGQARPHIVVFPGQSGHDIGHWLGALDIAHALTGAPDILPGLGLGRATRAERHRRFIRLGQIIGIQPGVLDRAPQIIAVHAGEQIGIDDIRGR